MPVTTSSKRALRRDRRRREVNKKIVLKYKQEVHNFRKKPVKSSLPKIYQALDRAVKKHVLHKNTAARLKSRLAARLRS